MNVRAVAGAIQKWDADTIVVNLFAGAKTPGGATGAVDGALNGALCELIEGGDFSGEAGQVAVVYPRGSIPARRVICVGLGPEEALDVDVIRRAAATAILKARELGAGRVASVLHGTGAGGLDVSAAAQAVAEGSQLALYQYQAPHREAGESSLQTFEIVVFNVEDLEAVQAGIDRAAAIADGVNVARDLVNLPPNICTPAYMAETATQVAERVGLRVQVLERGQMQALGMGALLAVAQGSDAPPRFVILEHNADRAAELDTIVLVGKGVTFDTGGYNLKSGEAMATMKVDMAGGAAVIGAMSAIGALNVPLHVVGLVPASDNMISGHAYRPSEVVTASNGVTIEIVSTDAEGRMLLADALVFAKRFEPAAVVDIATLTGACMVALGGVAAGLFSTEERLSGKLLAAADATSEKLWPMPLFPEYEKGLESLTADLKHSSGNRYGGVGVSATFLKHFVDYPAWAHIDMAGLAIDAKENPYQPKGATGYGVRLLAEFVRAWGEDR